TAKRCGCGVQRPGRPETPREQYWPAHARIQIRRSSAARPEASRPTLEAVDGNDIDALRREVKRLRGQVARLEEGKQELERRIGFMQRQVEGLRAKIPRGISTS